jgi:hypothetical protein
MTEPTDMLPALSGIAKSVEHLQPGKYIAGLWERDIALQLGWIRSEGAPRMGLHGPTFSWVATKYPVHWPSFFPNELPKVRCKYVDSTCKLATANPYGHVHECSITVRGLKIPTTKVMEHEATEIISDDPQSNVASEGIAQGCTLFCLELYRRCHWAADTPRTVALVLQYHKETNEFKRIGIMTRVLSSSFDTYGVEETITII